MDIVASLLSRTAKTLPQHLRVARLMYELRIAADARTFGVSVYTMLYVLGVEGLPPLDETPRHMGDTRKLKGPALSLAQDFGKRMFGMVMKKVRDGGKEMVEEILNHAYIKLLENQGTLRGRLSGMTLDEAEKYLTTIVLNVYSDFRERDNRYRGRKLTPSEKGDEPGPTDVMDAWESPTALRGLENMVQQSDIDLDRVVSEIQRMFKQKGREDLAKDIPLYLDLKMDGVKDSRIVNDRMLPSLKESPMSDKNWYKEYQPIVKKVFQQELSKTAALVDDNVRVQVNLEDKITKLHWAVQDDLKEFESAWEKYRTEPQKFKPQIDNALQSINSVGTQVRVISRNLEKLRGSFKTASSSDSYQSQLEQIQMVFVGDAAKRLHQQLEVMHNHWFGGERPANWDYGYPEKKSGGWACRIWARNEMVPGTDADKVEPNLDLQIQFGDKVEVKLVMGNRTTIFDKSFGSDVTPSVIMAYCADAWGKVVGRSTRSASEGESMLEEEMVREARDVSFEGFWADVPQSRVAHFAKQILLHAKMLDKSVSGPDMQPEMFYAEAADIMERLWMALHVAGDRQFEPVLRKLVKAFRERSEELAMPSLDDMGEVVTAATKVNPEQWSRKLEDFVLDNPLPAGDGWDIVKQTADEFKVECRNSAMFLHAKVYDAGTPDAVISVIGKNGKGKSFKRQIAWDDKAVDSLIKLLKAQSPKTASLGDVTASLKSAMGGKGEVIESKAWKHKDTGATASLYGAVPWSGAPGDQESDWKVESRGWTIRWEDGTIGIGRQPFKTKQEAQDFLDKKNKKSAGDTSGVTRALVASLIEKTGASKAKLKALEDKAKSGDLGHPADRSYREAAKTYASLADEGDVDVKRRKLNREIYQVSGKEREELKNLDAFLEQVEAHFDQRFPGV